MKKILQFLFINLLLLFSVLYARETGFLQGNILDDHEEPLSYAHIDLLNTNKKSFSELNGLFFMEGVPAGSHDLKITRIGYGDTVIQVEIQADEITEVRVILYPEAFRAEAPEQKTPEREIFEREIVLSERILYQDEISGGLFFQGSDALNIARKLPGIDFLDDFASQPFFRGGSSDQSRIIFDRAPLYNPYHLGGLVSALNASSIRNLKIISGGLPPHYGEKLGGVLEFYPKDGSKSNYSGNFNLSPLWGSAQLEGPITSKASLIFTGKTALLKQLPFDFYDFWGKLHLKPANWMNNSLGILFSGDQINFQGDESETLENTPQKIDFDWSSKLLYWNNQFLLGGKLLSMLSLSYSSFGTRMDQTENISTVFLIDTLSDLSISCGIEYFGISKHLLNWGLQYNGYYFNYLYEANGVPFLKDSGTENQISLYGQDKFYFSQKITFEYGLRSTYFARIKSLLLSPNLKVKYMLNDNLALKAGWVLQYQYIHSLFDDDLYFPLNLWVFSDQSEPASAHHFILSLEQWLGNDYCLSLEGWWIRSQRIIRMNDHPISLDDLYIEGDGDARGLELFMKRSRGNPKGWLGVTFLKAEQNFGEDPFPSKSDRPFKLELMLQIALSSHWSMGLGYQYGSGLPYGELMQKRFPAYSRTDIAIAWEKNIANFHLRPYLEIRNLFGNKNLTRVQGEGASLKETGVLPPFMIPMIGLEGWF
ncbi:TonB-dependent receptor [bacterium]|nr:TonB-dependent receptor [bacterium]